MKSKEEVKKLIGMIKTATGYTQQEISVKAGYAERSITQILSSGEGLDTLYKQLVLVFGDRLKKSTSTDKATPPPAHLKDEPAEYGNTVPLIKYAEMLEKHYNDLKETKDAIAANNKLLSQSIERLTAILEQGQKDLDDVVKKQRIFRVMTGVNQQLMLETLAQIQNKPPDSLVKEGRSRGRALLQRSQQTDKLISEDSLHK